MDYKTEVKGRLIFEKPKYTQTPNILFDELMKDMGEAELKITLCIIRKIVGYHKTKPEAISISQIQDMTGLSRRGAIDGTEKVEKRGLIRKAGTGKRGVSLYELVFSDENSELVKPVDQSTTLTRTSEDSLLELVKPVDTQKKALKESSKENIAPLANKPLKPQELLALAMGKTLAKGDWSNFGKVCKTLAESGIHPQDYPTYMGYITKLSKSEGNWTITVNSLVSNGRMSGYLTEKQSAAKTAPISSSEIAAMSARIEMNLWKEVENGSSS